MKKIKFSQLGSTDAIHCKTEQEAIELFKFFIKKDKRWANGQKYDLDYLMYDDYKNKIYYSLDGYCGNINNNCENRAIIPFEEVDFEEFPVNWCLPLTGMSHKVLQELNEWRIQQPGCNYLEYILDEDCILLSKHECDNSYYYTNTLEKLKKINFYDDYREITLEEFYTNILNKQEMNTNEESLLDKAKRLYPIGTKVNWLAGNDGTSRISFIKEDEYRYYWNNTSIGYTGSPGYVYVNGIWADIIEDELPEEWCIKVTDDNRDIIDEWKQKQRPYSETAGLDDAIYVNHNALNDNSGKHTEITLGQFIKHVLKKETITMENFKLNFIQAQSIINIACTDWNNRLSDLWGKTLLKNGYVSITKEFYNEMINASNSSQKDVINGIMGEHFKSKEINLKDRSTFNNLALFMPDGDFDTSLIAIRCSESTNKFYLNSRYSWKIEDYNLVCTKK